MPFRASEMAHTHLHPQDLGHMKMYPREASVVTRPPMDKHPLNIHWRRALEDWFLDWFLSSAGECLTLALLRLIQHPFVFDWIGRSLLTDIPCSEVHIFKLQFFQEACRRGGITLTSSEIQV
ncbi:hypothetical protein BDN72DRAFT_587845 [Pluteus cervinus]|uniref:Uncharacterized protein n=1 Tax=Pluteus cervinus TaxID=181527 RepID=A0ACD3AW63_9AGAR|nr:hypothetical protein BDN72DRAFT_587845 [Pluteus cervinus]